MSSSPNSQAGATVQLDPDFYERLFAGAGLAIFVCDHHGRILAANPIGEGFVRAHARGAGDTTLRTLLPSEHHSDLSDALEIMCCGGEPVEFRTRLPDAQDRIREYAVWFTPLADEPNAIAVWFHDITERLRMRRRTRRDERLTALGTLAGSVAHHYNNLIGSAAISLDLAMNMNTMSAMRRTLRRTADGLTRASELTRQLLAFAQADFTQSDRADLTEMTLQFVDENEARLAAADIRIDLDWELVPVTALPREQFRLVLDNIVCNSADVMPDGGVIRITLRRRDERHVALTLTDTGPGIPPEHLERLFDPFFTTKGVLGDGQSRQQGMGLAVAHGLINEFGGAISASNAPEGGARIEIVIPISSETRSGPPSGP